MSLLLLMSMTSVEADSWVVSSSRTELSSSSSWSQEVEFSHSKVVLELLQHSSCFDYVSSSSFSSSLLHSSQRKVYFVVASPLVSPFLAVSRESL